MADHFIHTFNTRIDGEPLPKQSFRSTRYGNYIEPRVKAWQDTVTTIAGHAFRQSFHEPFAGRLYVGLTFARSTRRKVDLDNLAKAVLDGLEGVVFDNDSQIVTLILHKFLGAESPGVSIVVKEMRPEGDQ